MQRFEKINAEIRQSFLEYKRADEKRMGRRLALSWSNWGFGLETFELSCQRLEHSGINHIELHGNHYGPDLGYDVKHVLKVMENHGISASGVCGMFSVDNDLSSNRHIQRQAAIDYIKREVEFIAAVKGKYMLVCPGAVGRAQKYDDSEVERSLDSLLRVADEFVKNGIRAAIEPIRSAETSICHSFADAKEYIARLGHIGVQHINGDVYHMLVEESHIANTIWNAGEMLTNLHMADTNRCALGDGSLDLDTIIMALYLIGYNNSDKCFVTPEPLGPGGDPYPAQNAKTDPAILDKLVHDSIKYFREREDAVRAL